MRLLRTLTMMGLAGALASCLAGPRPVRGPVPLEWRALVGCYRLTQGPAAWTFALDSAASSSSVQGARAARSLWTARPEYAREYWLVTDRNTLVYVLHEGLWGQVMEFAVRGDSLAGTHYVFTDVVGREPPRVPAAAVREPCPAGGS
ncbi:hypothetical protein [Longimicrobium sp.]|uniref:hypothetical protein n=1 Tax=Longimicrobium sp. TaxID=2029185 RepID=UPI003B3A4A20